MLDRAYTAVEPSGVAPCMTQREEAPAAQVIRDFGRFNVGAVSLEAEMDEKRCTKCEEMRPLGDFCKHSISKDGLSHWCRECKSDWQRDNKEKVRKYRRTWYRSHQKEDAKRSIKWAKRHPLETQAKDRVHYEVRMGRMARPDKCSLCGRLGQIEAHHEDYNKPLNVEWLCRECHRERRRTKDSSLEEK